MARLRTSGGETLDATLEDVTLAIGCSIQSSVKRTGTSAFKVDTTTNSAATLTFGATLPTVAAAGTFFSRCYVRIETLPTSAATIFCDGAITGAIELTSAGKLQFWNRNGSVQVGVDSAETVVPGDGTWYRLELKCVVSAIPLVTTIEGSVNGVVLGSTSSGLGFNGASANQALCGYFDSGSPSGSVLYFDDIAINDATGSAQTGYPGSGAVVLLVPTADSAKGTGWTNDAAGTSNFFDAVDNKPPVGIADTTASTGLHQIRNATANANSNYDATMTTYTAAGIVAVDTINVIDPIIATAAPVSTSSKQGTVGVVSNPAITNVALGAGGSSGAFWSGVAAGTYPTGWKVSHGTVTYGSSVTVGTAPVMRITQVTSSTRIAMVCFMGMYVDYTPTIVPPLPYSSPYPQILPQ